MIFSFRSTEAKSIWCGNFVGSLPPDLQNLARRKLRMLNSARRLGDLRIPQGERKGAYSFAIDGRWHLSFVWSGRGAKEVEIVE